MADHPGAPTDSTPFAIVGLACRLPGARNIDEFWDLLARGGSDLGELPRSRFDRELVYDPERGTRAKSYSSIGGVCPEVPFDPSRCPVPPELVPDVDEAHLTLCDVAADACRSGGLDPFDLPQRRAGVYIGHTRGTSRAGDTTYATLVETTAQYLREVEEFRRLAPGRVDQIIEEIVTRVRAENPRRNSDGGPDLGASMAAALISHSFGLNGPYCALNAACASSLQALALGARSLQLGQIDMAIVGGASYCKADSLVLFSQAQSVTNSGSRPFDAEADGLVTSEGFVVLVVKTLERALADENKVFAVIRGIGVSSDGRGKSLWAPRKEGQVEAIYRAYGPDVDMARVQYVEAHATSTQVGDATEVSALAEAMQDRLPPGSRIPMGSVKANVGHTLETAGMAGLVKAVLAMRHGQIPRQINLRQLNPKIDWEHIPFFVPTETLDWPVPADGHPRRAAVNAFGIGGLNVHVVLDEFSPEHARQLVERTKRHRASAGAAAEPSHEPIAIIGMGAVLPGARTIDQAWELFASGHTQFHELPSHRWNPEVAFEPGSRRHWKSPTKLAGCITDFQYDWKRHKVPPKQIAAADPLQFMLLDAVDQAFQMSGYDEKPFDRKRTGVLVGTVFGGEFANQLQMGLRLPDFERTLSQVLSRFGATPETVRRIGKQFGDLLLERMPALMDETGSFTTSTLASRITKSFDLMGGAAAIDGNIPSALAVLAASLDQLRTGNVDLMVCAAGQRSLGLPAFEGMSLAGVLAHGEPHGPFDADSRGYLPGEAVGVLLLKRLSDAQRDGDTVHGIIHGMGIARGQEMSSAIAASIQEALRRTQIDARDVTCVEAGTPGVPAMDQAELTGLAEAYGGSREMPLVMGTAAGQLGFSTGCSAMTSLIKATLELRERQVAPNAGLGELAPLFRPYQDLVSIDTEAQPIPLANDEGRLFAAVNSFGKWNLAYHLILERPARVPRPRREPAPSQMRVGTESSKVTSHARIFRWQETSLANLRQATLAAAANLDELLECSSEIRFQLDLHRLAIVAEDRESLASKLELFQQCPENDAALAALEDRGIFHGEPREGRPKVAFLFAGQGSQYPGMLRSLIHEHPPAAEAMSRIEADLKRLGYPKFADFAWHPEAPLGEDVWLTQLSLLVADTLVACSLQSLGIQPDRLAGHSFGEFPALVAAGAWSFADAARATEVRCRSVVECSTAQGAMLAVSASAQQVHEWLTAYDGELHISHDNAPRQVVISGVETAIRHLEQQVGHQELPARRIPVPRPFHTPLMLGAQQPFQDGLCTIALDPPGVPLLSSVTNRYVADPDEIRRLLVEQLVTPVHYRGLVERLADEGVQVFVEVGPRQVLTRLNKQILAGRGLRIVATDHPRRSGRYSLLCAQACYEAAGARLCPREVESPAISDREPARVGTMDARNPMTRASHRSVISGPDPDSSGLMSPSSDGSAWEETLVTLRLRGTAWERGREHGQVRRAEIRRIVRRYAASFPSRLVDRGALLQAVRQADLYFDAESMDELRGIAEGAGVAVESLIAHNLQFYPDLAAGCCQVALRAGVNGRFGMLHGANEDLPLGLVLRDCLARHVQVNSPSKGQTYVTFPIAGQVGALSGINQRGIAVTSAMLLDLPRPHARPGRLHGLIVRRVLQEAETLEDAVRIAGEETGVGGWSLCVTHHPTDRIAYIEYDDTRCEADLSRPSVVAANHALLHSPTAETPPHSCRRLERLTDLLHNGAGDQMNAERLCSALRDRYDGQRGRTVAFPTMNTVRRVDNQISIVFQPVAGLAWIHLAGAQSSFPDQYLRIDLKDLFRSSPDSHSSNWKQSVAPPPTSTNGSGVSSKVPDLARTEPGPDDSTKRYRISSDQFRVAATSHQGQPPIGPRENICRRFVMRVMDAPLATSSAATPTWHGRAFILGDNPLGQALLARLRQLGAGATIAPSSDDPALAIAALETAWEKGPITHLFLVTPHDRDAEAPRNLSQWRQRRQRGVLTPYLLTQRWYQRLLGTGLLEQACLVTCGNLGGDFGFSDQVRAPESGALCGLTKALMVEVGRNLGRPMTAKAIDASPDLSAEQLADALCRELAAGSSDVEVAFDSSGRRYVVRPVIEPVDRLPRSELARGGTWVVTGGARGVTAVVARELGQRLGLTLHLIGSSPLPQVDPAWRDLDEAAMRALRGRIMKEAVARGEVPAPAWSAVEKAIEIDKNLRDFDSAGVQVTYHSCDVGDRAALEPLLERIRATDGPITGIVHGAGFERACRFDRKTPDFVERTISAKVDAAVHLMELTRQDPLQAFLAFGSISGRFGGNGQTDYCLANDLLAKLVHWYRQDRPDCATALFHWHSWDEVGMAVRPESMHIKKLFQFRYMPTREGVEHLVEEFRAGLPEGEVLITDWHYYKRFFPDDALHPAELLSATNPEPQVARGPAAPSEKSPASPTLADSARGLETPPDSSNVVESHVAHRHVMRLEAAPLAPHGPTSYQLLGPSLVLGDNQDARALAEAIRRQGHTVHLVSLNATRRELLNTLDRLWQAGAAPHLFLLSARDPQAQRPELVTMRERIARAYLFSQRWAQRMAEQQPAMSASLIAVTSLGGDFGFSGAVAAPEGGAMAGWLKSLYVESCRQERATLHIKVIDAPPNESTDSLVHAVLSELSAERSDVEVAYQSGRRFVVRADYQPAIAMLHSVPEHRLVDPVPAVRRGGTWLLTGGARGITARVALELGKRHGLNLHLLGRHPRREIDSSLHAMTDEARRQLKQQMTRKALAEGKSPTREWQNLMKDLEVDENLRMLHREGVSATYHACDLTDARALARVLDEIRNTSGPIEGIVHGAGLRTPARFEQVREVDLEATLAAKVEGTLALMELTRQDPLQWFIGFGSVGGRFGTNGGTLYALGNEMVAKLTGWFRHQRPECRAVCLHWHGWGEIGMMLGGASFGAQGILKMQLMPPDEGVDHLLNEMHLGFPESEILFTDGQLHRLFYPAGVVRGTPNSVCDAAAEVVPVAKEELPSATPRPPLIDRWGIDETGSRGTAECRLDPVRDPFLAQHRFRDRPLLPFVVAIEMMAEAASCFGTPHRVVGLEEVHIVNGWRFFDDKPQEARIQVARTGDALTTELVSDFHNRGGKLVQANRPYVRARVLLGDKALQPNVADPGETPAMNDVWYPAEREEVLFHGPIFRRLQAIHFDDTGGWARVVAPDPVELAGSRSAEGWLHSPATLDACLFACGIYPWFYQDRIIAIPHSIERLTFGRLPRSGETCLLRFNYLGRQELVCRFDFTLHGEDRSPLLIVEGFRASVIPGKATS